VGKSKQFEDKRVFRRLRPRRTRRLLVSVLVQESGKHGGEAAGPVVRDLIKVYYDKKNKKDAGPVHDGEQEAMPEKVPAPVARLLPCKHWKPRIAPRVCRANGATVEILLKG